MTTNYGWVFSVAMLLAGTVLMGFDNAFARLSGYVLVVGMVVMTYLRLRASEDEVLRAANAAAMTVGAPVGLGLAFVSLFVARFVPAVSDYINALTVHSSEALGAGAAGFGIGILFTCFTVVASAVIVWVGWWMAMRA
ncbi:MAG: hypothetical protein QF921_10430 [Pseudomonadales bacterium]|jgi:hypothetical protein|nr:hypothetical protein [Pseudomonadales bacterium]MDP6469748.1 hypothetical protein [Pseudomonadales bacterium]MDP6827650.1 hypothetical protein [Pseudomonadales bacterium]MDP6971909.1 hypothetical protein [Pseudomonadales bacterium]|tara:strand:- start:36 stop:449 length:414 start_codon:yes stop_codon:yes gene_type:complete